MKSISRTLTWGLAGSVILLSIIITLLTYLTLNNTYKTFFNTRLNSEIESLVSTLEIQQQKIVLDEDKLNLYYSHIYSGHYFIISTHNQRVQSRSLWDFSSIPQPQLAAGKRLRREITGPDDQQLILLSQGFSQKGLPFTITVAEDVSVLTHHFQVVTLSLVAGLITVLIVLILLQQWLLKKSLKPLVSLATSIQSLKNGELTTLSTSQTPKELIPLVETINQLLENTAALLSRSRNATGDLGHSLKTPLAVIQQLAQTELNDHPVKSQLLKQTNTIRALTEQTLTKARLAGNILPGALFDPQNDLMDLIHSLDTIYQHKQTRIEWQPHQWPNRLHINREDALELLGNLLDNACKWSKSTVLLNISTQENTSTITIDDDGPGIDDAQLHMIIKRGKRLDEQVEGHGLGLNIVENIVKYYKGTINFKGHHPSLGGLSVSINLPQSPTNYS
ncbi:ATP-binding protein [Zooshikella ganghwensis]|uniref:histidine kinase n=1 Tax=Zooshikella ganghwensis TaxID=202772 RepID=A0A4P9VJ64_9GAMM|nr:ATP-binding protein [Zooshikella ganghwensis]RDH42220.1 GHKL domain-containing protein [Zooshikella ganghwensis]